MAELSGFEAANARLTDLTQQQQGLRAAVDAGQLWMDADVAEHAAQRCEQAVSDIDDLLADASRRIKRMPLGDNDDGNAAADRFDLAARAFMKAMHDAQPVLRNMAATYRAAGRTLAQADQASAHPFKGQRG